MPLDRDNSKLLGRALSKGMALFVIIGLSIFLIALLVALPISWETIDWSFPLSWWPLALEVILVSVILVVARSFFPLRWNAENGLLYQPLRYLPMQLIGTIVWGLIGYFGIWGAINFADVGIRVAGGIFGLFGAFAALYFFYKVIQRIWQYTRFGNSTLAIDPNVPRLGAEIKVKLIEQKLSRYSPEVDIAFRQVKEKIVTQGKRGGKSSAIRRVFQYEHLARTTIDELTRTGLALQIPREGVEPTDYDPVYPCYWELVVYKADIDYEARFLIYVNA